MTCTPKSSKATIDGKDYQLTAFYYPGKDTSWDTYYQAPFLGNFWESILTLTIDNVTATFHTAEAAFQATKWWMHKSIRKQFEAAKTGSEAFSIKKHLSVPADYSYAGLGRNGAMLAVLEAKFKDKELQAALLATKEAYLLEHNSVVDRDRYWSDNHDGTGKNMLGVSLMLLRGNLGGSNNSYYGAVTDMTNNVQTSTRYKTSEKKAVKIIPSVYSGDGKVGDFGWMITQPEYAKTFFIFNDNVSQFQMHQDHPNNLSGCSIGGGNAIIRPYQCKTPPQAGGIPTGPSFSGLTPDVKQMIDVAIQAIKNGIQAGDYNSVAYSSNGHGGLGTSIFKVPEAVKTYIVAQINTLSNF